MKCQRCNKEAESFRMSRFNTEMCCEDCLVKEARHPAYQKACEAELAHIKAGDYNFQGIGKPADL